MASKKEGQGILSDLNGQKYVGNWTKDLRSGDGSQTYLNGDR